MCEVYKRLFSNMRQIWHEVGDWWWLEIMDRLFFLLKKIAFGVNFDVTMSPIRFDCDMTTDEPTMLIDPSIDFQGGNEMKTCLSTQMICFLFFWALLKLMGKVDCNGFRSNARKMTTPILPHYLFLWILGTLPLPSSRMFAVDGLDLLFLYQSACKHLRRLWSESFEGICTINWL